MKPTLLLSISPSSGLPLYRQLIDQFRALIATGKLAPGELLPSVRQVAQDLQINPMTVSKAYSLLERDGIVELVRGQGMRILSPAAPTTRLKQREQSLLPLLQQVAASAYQLGLTQDQVLALLTPLLEELDHD
jgi:GntR family transcriptional regulator